MLTAAVAALALPGATSTEEIPIGTILSQWGSYREVATAMQARPLPIHIPVSNPEFIQKCSENSINSLTYFLNKKPTHIQHTTSCRECAHETQSTELKITILVYFWPGILQKCSVHE